MFNFLASHLRRAAVVNAVVLVALTLGLGSAAANSDDTLRIEAVSNRADLVSGGDLLLRVTLPRKASGVLSVNGTPVPGALHPAPDGHGYLALVTGLPLGRNTITLSARGYKEHLTVTNHPISGPIFSGPHLQPWTCTTDTVANGLGPALDANCNAPTRYAFFYKSTLPPVPPTTSPFVAYDPANPPAASLVATTTTDRGVTVPYIVRQETGTLNRTIYRITVLFDPTKPWSPWAPQAAWNGKVLYLFGAGAGTMYTQGTIAAATPAGFAAAFDDNGLSRGFATAAAVMTIHGTNANTKMNAEALMMVKERLAETYGPIRYTIGSGCSGGAIQQHSIGDQYPGLVDGFLPVCSYPDTWSLAVNSHDCHVLTPYFNATSPSLWTNPAHRLAILGQTSEQECPGQDGPGAFGGRWFPVTNASCLLPADALYHPLINPQGVRCSLDAFHINELGTRPDGFTFQTFDNVGVQYGLKAVQDGRISPEQFVDLNEKIGGLDIAGNYQPQRTLADLQGLERIYRTGLITYGRELGKYPVIDARTDDNHEMHNNSEWMFTRFRLLRTNGHAANQVHWWENSNVVNPVGNVSRPSPATALRSFNLMDQWLAAIEADRSSLPHEKKVTRNKPAAARDACVVDGVEYDWTPGSVCDAKFTYTGLIRMTAGGPVTNDVLKCQLKPLSRLDYSVSFTDAQWARLQSTFASGVCDYSKRGVGQGKPKPWLTFADGPGGRSLGKPPVSRSGDRHHDEGDDRDGDDRNGHDRDDD
jgi:hypothetical protein